MSHADETIVGSVMWHMAEQYTGRVGYRGATKAEGLSFKQPVIDCSGWAALLISTAMSAVNEAAQRVIFSADERASIQTWSDRMIEVVETRSGFILGGDEISDQSLPRFALIGLRQGGGAWAANHPRPRGITHVVQVMSRPGDGAAFVSESQGWAEPYGLRLLPLGEWIEVSRPWLRSGEAWAVDPFATNQG